jgi:hypothetical protein
MIYDLSGQLFYKCFNGDDALLLAVAAGIVQVAVDLEERNASGFKETVLEPEAVV